MLFTEIFVFGICVRAMSDQRQDLSAAILAVQRSFEKVDHTISNAEHRLKAAQHKHSEFRKENAILRAYIDSLRLHLQPSRRLATEADAVTQTAV
jgi:predicted  nucleic acid-binding Zn-ribbon protein